MVEVPFDLGIHAGPNPFALGHHADELIRDVGRMLLNAGPGAIHRSPQEVKDALLICLLIKELKRQGDL